MDSLSQMDPQKNPNICCQHCSGTGLQAPAPKAEPMHHNCAACNKPIPAHCPLCAKTVTLEAEQSKRYTLCPHCAGSGVTAGGK